MFRTNDDNLNDTVRHFGENERRDLISEAGDKWAPGALIVAVGRHPQRMGVYCGDDVCDAVNRYSEGRLDGILDRTRPPLRNGNLAAGLLEGTKAVADPTAVREPSDGPGWTGWLFGGIAAVLGAAGHRHPRTLAHPPADDALRRQWNEIKTGFLGLNTTFDQLEGLQAGSSDKEFRARRKEISEAHEQATRLRTAEKNIEQLARMEHGDAGVAAANSPSCTRTSSGRSPTLRTWT